MNYQALDEALALIDGKELSLEYQFNALIESTKIVDIDVVTEGFDIKSAINKIVDAIKKFINWIFTKLEEIFRRAVNFIKTSAIRSRIDSLKAKAKKNGTEAALNRVLNEKVTFAYMIKTENIKVRMGNNDIDLGEMISKVGDDLLNDDSGMIKVVEGSINEFFAKDDKFFDKIIKNYSNNKKVLLDKKVDLKRTQEVIEKIKAENSDSPETVKNMEKCLAASSNRLKACEVLRQYFLAMIKFNANSMKEVITKLREAEV